MPYLLIDLGASFLKSVIYDPFTGQFSNAIRTISPFASSDAADKGCLKDALDRMLHLNPNTGDMAFCCIMGGGWVGDTYHSWKSKTKQVEPRSGPILEVTGSGEYLGRNILGCWPDTHCTILGAELEDGDVLINMGTGSQVVWLAENGENRLWGRRYHIHSFIPAGRALNVMSGFYMESGGTLWSDLSLFTVSDLERSSLRVGLGVFPEANGFNAAKGGYIEGIDEGNFTMRNLAASILRSFLDQYIGLIPASAKRLMLAGGIAEKLPVIPRYFEQKTKKLVVIKQSIAPMALQGLAKAILNRGI